MIIISRDELNRTVFMIIISRDKLNRTVFMIIISRDEFNILNVFDDYYIQTDMMRFDFVLV